MSAATYPRIAWAGVAIRLSDGTMQTFEADVYLCSTCMAVITFTTGEAPRCPNCPPPADEPAPVPPPVDALLKGVEENTSAAKALIDLVNDYGVQAHAFGLGDAGASDTMTEVWREINDKIRTLWAAGVEEGRRQLDAEIHASVFTSARLAAAEAGFGPAPESVTVSYERRASAGEQGIYAAGVAEGRRQAERTEVTIHVEPPGQRWQPEMTAEMRRQASRWQPEGFHG